MPDQLAEHRLGVDAGRPLRGPLVRGQQGRHVGGVGRGREPGGQARREPVDRHVGVGHAAHSPTHARPRLHASAREDADGRHARTTTQQPSQETLTRNWDELLQEIRVTQTGVQILTGFLLTVPFSNRFADLTAFQRDVYLAVLAGSVLTTGLVVAPVAMHRVLFRQRRRELLVESGNRFAMAGLAMLAADRLRGGAARRRRRRRRHRRAGSRAARSCSCSPCSGRVLPRVADRSTTARATPALDEDEPRLTAESPARRPRPTR